jgi:hypothetical protein
MFFVPSLVHQRDAVREIGRRRRVESQRRRETAVFTAGCGVVVLFLFLPLWASINADSVKNGVVKVTPRRPESESIASGRYLPWRALPAHVTWAANTKAQPLTNTCDALRLLGVANGQSVLYDSKLDVVFRVSARAGAVASARTLDACRKLARRARKRSVVAEPRSGRPSGSPVELGVSRGQERPREQGFRR